MDKMPDKLTAKLSFKKGDESFIINGHIYFHNGEFICDKFRMLGGDLTVYFSYGNEDFSYPVHQVGGKYFVSNQKKIPLFSNVQLFQKMENNIEDKIITKKKKI